MKTSHFFYFLLAVILFSCNEGNRNANEDYNDHGAEFENYGEGYEDYGNYENESRNDYENDYGNGSGNGSGGDYANNKNQSQNNINTQNNMNTRNSGGGRTKNYKMIDSRDNTLIGTMPVPSNWNPTNDSQVILEGPGGVKVYKENSNFFSYSNNPQMNQMAQQSGQNVKRPMSVENFIQQELVPFAQKQGAQFVKQYPIEQLARFDQALYSKFYQYTPMQKRHTVMAVEFKGNDGKSSIVVVRHQVGQDQQGTMWGYVCNMMEANTSSFEQAKQAYLYGLTNTQINPQWIQACYQRDAQIAQRSNAGHQTRMGQIKAFGAANTARYNERSRASDARHNDYMNRQRSSDKSQAAYVDGIWDRRNMTNGNGDQVKVDGYDKTVWMNENNQYIGTDNPNWNPNIDNITNGGNWEQLQETDDGGW